MMLESNQIVGAQSAVFALLKMLLMSVLFSGCSKADDDQGVAAGDVSMVANEQVIPDASNVSAERLRDPELIAQGKKLYFLCQACHAIEASDTSIRVGPSLHGIYLRESASVEGYDYSQALKSQSFVWDAATLDQFLENPASMVSGTKMSFAGIKQDDARHAVIAYLSTL